MAPLILYRRRLLDDIYTTPVLSEKIYNRRLRPGHDLKLLKDGPPATPRSFHRLANLNNVTISNDHGRHVSLRIADRKQLRSHPRRLISLPAAF